MKVPSSPFGFLSFLFAISSAAAPASTLTSAKASAAAPPPPGGWEVVGSPGVSAGPVVCCQIASDANGVMHVAYQDDSLGTNPASVLRFSAGSWSLVGAQGGASLRQAWYNHLAFDGAGMPYLACRDYGVNGKVNVRRFDLAAGAWADVGSPGPSAGEAHYTDIAIGPGGTYVVYADRTTVPADCATVLRFSNGAWSTVGSPGVSHSKADYPSIALDPTGAPTIAFRDRGMVDATFTGRVSVMRYDTASGAWSYVGPRGFSPTGGSNVRLSFDRTGAPCVAYQQYHTAIYVWRFDGAQWLRIGTSASGPERPTVETEGWRQWLSLAFDSQNAPYVAYQRLDNQDKAAVRRFDGSSWVPVGQLGFSAPDADYMAMTVDGFDVPWVVFRDSTQGGRATVMRYAPSPHSYCTPSTDQLGCTPHISTNGSGPANGVGPFDLAASGVVNGRTGLLLYSAHPARMPFPGATMCVAPPFRAVGRQNSGGNPSGADCSGALSFDFAAWIGGDFDPGLAPGRMVFAQFWYRDPFAQSGAGLTDALRFEVGL